MEGWRLDLRTLCEGPTDTTGGRGQLGREEERCLRPVPASGRANPSPLHYLTTPWRCSSPSLEKSLEKVYWLFLLTRKPERLSCSNRPHSQQGLESGFPFPSAPPPAPTGSSASVDLPLTRPLPSLLSCTPPSPLARLEISSVGHVWTSWSLPLPISKCLSEQPRPHAGSLSFLASSPTGCPLLCHLATFSRSLRLGLGGWKGDILGPDASEFPRTATLSQLPPAGHPALPALCPVPCDHIQEPSGSWGSSAIHTF